ncbi:GUN4 domain-containing protein [Gloeothece verrucosa]|uniref:GUN4 domain protein n=1 Tax=Gloeothece verrucosa (strain PCC 7822) TaxID=497965 RepID=E0UFG7_GLOV7|nr:GUN4 domain-containing protein [Gloeothece verrucosa]ADN16661.1 GUN4 domain protein [Gloeothece verrucosa PCC 7822]
MSNSYNEGQQELSNQLAEIKLQLTRLTELSSRLAWVEETLLLVEDIYRYEKLQKALLEGDWFEADLETIKIILDLTGKDKDNLKPEDIQYFPVASLKVIDKLWLKYSQGKFGFTVQLKIYQQLGGNLDTTIAKDQKLIEKWGEQLGWRDNHQWRKCDELDYSFNAPTGCHPSQWWNSPYGSKMTNYFLARLIKANL